MDDLSAILASIFSSGTFNEMLRRATPVALAAIGGSLTEHAGIMNIGMDGMILMGAFFGVFGSYLFTSAWGGVGLVLLMGLLVGLFFAQRRAERRTAEQLAAYQLHHNFTRVFHSFLPSRAPESVRQSACTASALQQTLHITKIIPQQGRICNYIARIFLKCNLKILLCNLR